MIDFEDEVAGFDDYGYDAEEAVGPDGWGDDSLIPFNAEFLEG